MNDVVELSGLPPGAAEALASGTLRDPFAVLGPIDTAGGRIVRVFLPGALEVAVVSRSTCCLSLGRLSPMLPQGLFAGPVGSAEPYLLHITWPGAVQETEDPYSFGPLLGDLDLHLFNEGRHFELASHLGANVTVIDGVSWSAVCRMGTERAGGVGGRRLQYLGPATQSDAAALSGGRLGVVHPQDRRRSALQVRHRRPRRVAAAIQG